MRRKNKILSWKGTLFTIFSLLLLAIVTGCSIFPNNNYRTPFSVRNPLIHGELEDANGDYTEYLQEKAQAFICTYKAARNFEKLGMKTKEASKCEAIGEDYSHNDLIRRYVGAGIIYSQLLCKNYFDRHTLTKARRDFAKMGTNITGGLASALMGLAKTNASVVAGTGALFSFGEATFDAYDEAFIVSPELSELERLVKEKQKEEEVIIYKKLNAEAGKTWPDKIETLDQGERSLNDYIFHCTVNGMKILLDSSVQKRAEDIKKNTPLIQNNEKNESPTLLELQRK
uniref:Lipoprotein n=1 Tax=Candidatus Kentrum sp. UNK TaxID=2126344 RepID=A0A451AQU6_9GAMM|nr:MAG: hypothetical protein BECKUNK1418G_GA0071005_12303 [Candidatus Kentron sp. UNK]VFK73574.1 MAG: hypothetical protein BECKUNK1418H_GA0071006_12223 [Candidatus Kentron sp. UNK]